MRGNPWGCLAAWCVSGALLLIVGPVAWTCIAVALCGLRLVHDVVMRQPSKTWGTASPDPPTHPPIGPTPPPPPVPRRGQT